MEELKVREVVVAGKRLPRQSEQRHHAQVALGLTKLARRRDAESVDQYIAGADARVGHAARWYASNIASICGAVIWPSAYRGARSEATDDGRSPSACSEPTASSTARCRDPSQLVVDVRGEQNAFDPSMRTEENWLARASTNVGKQLRKLFTRTSSGIVSGLEPLRGIAATSVVVTLSAMAGRKRNRNAATPAERQQAERDAQLAIYRLQDSAYANLRNGVAVTSIVLGLFIGYDAIGGSADGARLLPSIVCLLAALLGIAYFATRSRPRLSLRLLLAATVTLVVGLAGLVIAVYLVQP